MAKTISYRNSIKYLLASLFSGIIIGLFTMPTLAKSDQAQGPVNKGTGSIEIFEPYDNGHRKVQFTAQEAAGNKMAKGNLIDMVFGPDGSLRRKFMYEVKYVLVDGEYVYFAAQNIYDSDNVKTGDWLYIKAHDGGEPGYMVDHIGWKWADSEVQAENWVNNMEDPAWFKESMNANIQIHQFE
jgi:hypothetical protein